MFHSIVHRSAAATIAGAASLLLAEADAVQAGDELVLGNVAEDARAFLERAAEDVRVGQALHASQGDAEADGAHPVRIKHPGAPAVGQCLLRAHDVLGDPTFLAAATDAGRALAWYQSGNGGWPTEIKSSPPPPATDEGMTALVRQKRHDTLDDDSTQGAVRFLIDLDEQLDAPWLDEAVALGLDFMVESQRDAGGWPQYYPLIGNYHDFYTFNDGATNNAIEVMLKAHGRSGEPRYLESALRGAAFIAASQLPEPQAGWAQQYDRTLKPAAARAFEPAAVSSSTTSRNILTLLDIAEHTGDPQYLEPIPDAIAWLQTSALDDETWARFYELGTNRPIYPSRSGVIVDSLEQLPAGEQSRYAYVGGFDVEKAINLYQHLVDNGAYDFETWRDQAVRSEAAWRAKKATREIADVLTYAEDKANAELSLKELAGMCGTVLDYLEYR